MKLRIPNDAFDMEQIFNLDVIWTMYFQWGKSPYLPSQEVPAAFLVAQFNRVDEAWLFLSVDQDLGKKMYQKIARLYREGFSGTYTFGEIQRMAQGEKL